VTCNKIKSELIYEVNNIVYLVLIYIYQYEGEY